MNSLYYWIFLKNLPQHSILPTSNYLAFLNNHSRFGFISMTQSLNYDQNHQINHSQKKLVTMNKLDQHVEFLSNLQYIEIVMNLEGNISWTSS